MEKAFEFLRKLSQNNNREWFQAHKAEYDAIVKENKKFFEAINAGLQETDSIQKMHIFRIYRDVRFKKDKTPYKQNFGVSFSRTKPLLRGGYYLHLEPDNSFVGGGFWSPSPEDLLRIRKEFELDMEPINKIVNDDVFKQYFGELKGEDGVKTAPKGFDKNHPAIHLIRKKQFVLLRPFTDKEVFAPNFKEEVLKTFLAERPFFDYMSDVLTTNLNGELIY